MDMATALAAAARKERSASGKAPGNYKATIARLDAISRTRALTDAETDELERAIKCERQANGCGPRSSWTPERDRLMLDMRASGAKGRDIAAKLGLTVRSVEMRARRLRQQEGKSCGC